MTIVGYYENIYLNVDYFPILLYNITYNNKTNLQNIYYNNVFIKEEIWKITLRLRLEL